MIPDWPGLKSLALSLNLPQVTVETPWGNETPKVLLAVESGKCRTRAGKR